MEEAKKQKVIRIVGLVTLTILVVVGVILTIYFVQKADQVYVGQIGETISLKSYDFTVTDFKTDKETINEDSVEVTTFITIEANKNMKLKIKDFSLNGYELKDTVGFPEKINKGEKVSFELNWVVKTDSKLLYLIYKNIKIELGEVQL